MLSSPIAEAFLSRWMLPFLSQPYFLSTHTSIQGESSSEKKYSMSSSLPDPAPMPEHDKQQQLVDESPAC
jgi:hypothetical protein